MISFNIPSPTSLPGSIFELKKFAGDMSVLFKIPWMKTPPEMSSLIAALTRGSGEILA